MKLSVVIPVYGCRAALFELHKRLVESISELTDDYEIIFVNDACPQNSIEDIRTICKEDTHSVGIELSRNFGQMKAILAGLDYSTGDWVVVMDCDLQDRPEDIVNLYNKAQEGYDAVFAKRNERQDSKIKSFFAKTFYKIYNYATDGCYDGDLCNFSIISRKVVNSYCKIREQHRGYVMYVKWLGFYQTEIEVTHDARFEGDSSYTFSKKVKMALELLTSQSDKILRLFVKLGLIASLFFLLVIIGLVIYRITSNVSIGWTSLIATVMFVGSLIISAIGVVGIYIGNIFIQTKDRPLYVIRNVYNKEENN